MAVRRFSSGGAQQRRHVDAVTIVGGVVGGIGLFALGALLFLFFRRRHRRDLRRRARRTSIILEESYPTAVEPFVARPTPDNWQHHPNEKTYVGNSSSSLAVLPLTVMEEGSRTHSRTESTTTPDLATVARKVERIANILDTWTPPDNVQQATDLEPPPTAPPRYTRTTTSRS